MSRGVFVLINQAKLPWWKRLRRRRRPPIINSVTYGGVAMTRAIEEKSAVLYYLGRPEP